MKNFVNDIIHISFKKVTRQKVVRVLENPTRKERFQTTIKLT